MADVTFNYFTSAQLGIANVYPLSTNLSGLTNAIPNAVVLDDTDGDGIFDDQSTVGIGNSNATYVSGIIGGPSSGDLVVIAGSIVVVDSSNNVVGNLYIWSFDGPDADLTLDGIGSYYYSVDFTPLASETYRTTDVPFVNLVICFTQGTMILTDQGQRPVETLCIGRNRTFGPITPTYGISSTPAQSAAFLEKQTHATFSF